MASGTPARERFLSDVVLTSAEWMRDYGKLTDLHWFFPDRPGGTAKPSRNGQANAHYRWKSRESGGGWHIVTRSLASIGVERVLAAPNDFEDEEELYNEIAGAAASDGHWGELDVEAATVIIQYGLFNEWRYS